MIRALVASLCGTALLVVSVGYLYATWGERRDRRRFPAPGRLVPVDGCALHVHLQGREGPAVVLEAGIAASSLSWRPVECLLKDWARVVSYDRSGLGWSERCRAPRTLRQITAELTAVLERASVAPPYILVGHSFGGLLIWAFAQQHPEHVAGMVLVDPVSIESWSRCSEADRRRLQYGAKLARRGALLARVGVVRLALAVTAARGGRVTAGIARASAGRATPFLARLVGEVRKLPSEVMPIVRAHWSSPKGFLAMADHLEALPACAETAKQFVMPPHIPFIVLSAATATKEELQERDAWVIASGHGEHRVIEEAGHWLQVDRPDVVASAVKRLIELR